MAKPEFIIRQMNVNDFDEVLKIGVEVGFTIAKHELEFCFNLDPNGYFVAQNSSGQIIGYCSGIKLLENFGYIGSYAVRPQYQNIGIGSRIWDEVIKHIGNESNISLTSKEIMFNKYCKRFGSVVVCEINIILYFAVNNCVNCDLLVNQIMNISIIHLNEENLQIIANYDKSVCGFNKESMYRQILKQSDAVMIAAFDENIQQIVGICKMTLSNLNYILVQPLYANNAEIAELLLRKGLTEMSKHKSEGVVICIFETHLQMKFICEKIGLKHVYKLKRLYTKTILDCDSDKIFAISSPHFFPF